MANNSLKKLANITIYFFKKRIFMFFIDISAPLSSLDLGNESFLFIDLFLFFAQNQTRSLSWS